MTEARAVALILRTPTVLTPSQASTEERIKCVHAFSDTSLNQPMAEILVSRADGRRFLQAALGISEERVGMLVYKTPIVLSCSIDNNMRPKIEFLTTHAGLPRAVIADNPVLLTLSLEHRIRPRVLAARAQATCVTVSLLKASDAAFLDATALTPARFRQIVQEAQQNAPDTEAPAPLLPAPPAPPAAAAAPAAVTS